jgi:hypothetical protein
VIPFWVESSTVPGVPLHALMLIVWVPFQIMLIELIGIILLQLNAVADGVADGTEQDLVTVSAQLGM